MSWWRKLLGGGDWPDDPQPSAITGAGSASKVDGTRVDWTPRLQGLSRASFDSDDFQAALHGEEEPGRLNVLRRVRELLGDHLPLLAQIARLGSGEAEQLWRRLASEPDYAAEAYHALVDVALAQGDRPEAARLAQRALAAAPGDGAALARALELATALGSGHSGSDQAAMTAGVAARPSLTPVLDRVPPGFTLARRLGAGGFGVVFEAVDAGLNRSVAIKFLHPHHAANAARAEAFFDEARLLASMASELREPGVVRLFTVDPVRHLLVMEFCAQGSLQDRLDVAGAMPDAAASLMAGPARALAELHERGVVHADLKPANLLFRAAGELVMTDFGVGAATAGTPGFRAPEQARGAKPAPPHDVHAVGAILTRLCGDEDGPEATLILELAGRCMVEAPGARPAMSEVAASLARLAAAA